MSSSGNTVDIHTQFQQSHSIQSRAFVIQTYSVWLWSAILDLLEVDFDNSSAFDGQLNKNRIMEGRIFVLLQGNERL